MAQETVNVAIVGMGKGGAALLEMLEGDDVVRVLGVAEPSPDAPGLAIAKRMGIPIHTDWKPLLQQEGLNDIIDVTGSQKIYDALYKEKPAGVDLMGGPSAKMMWLLIEERKEAEDNLRTQKDFTDSLIQNLPGLFYYFDEQGNLILWNQNFETTSGFSHEEIRKMKSLDFFPDEDKENVANAIKGVFEGTQTVVEANFRTKDGKTIPHQFNGFNLKIDGKNHLVGFAIDVTERKKAEEELMAVNQELESFTYTASHDLKEPLRSLQTFSQFLLEDYAEKLDDEGKDYLKRISAGAMRMHNLIDDLLALSRISRIKNPYESVDSEVLVKDAIKRLKAVLDEKNVTMTVDDELPHVFCDNTKMKEVFYNLITNAMKYNDKPKPSIEIGTKDKTTFFVKDNGNGIDKEHIDLIFEPFKRGPSGKGFVKGSGVGLALVKKIVEEHNGKIWVESEPGKGSTFYFTMPLHKENSHD